MHVCVQESIQDLRPSLSNCNTFELFENKHLCKA